MNNIEKPKKDVPRKLDVKSEITLIRQQCTAMGANHDEFDRLDEIEKAHHNKEITPEEAVQRAREVLTSKQGW